MSETTNLKLFKHDNPTTNTDQFDVDKSLNENWDKIDEAHGQLNVEKEKLKIQVTELEEELQAKVTELETENEALRSQIPSGELEGNQIHIEDSSDLPCEIILKGNAEQEVREGYNLIDFPTQINFTATSTGQNIVIEKYKLYAGTFYYAFNAKEGIGTVNPILWLMSGNSVLKNIKNNTSVNLTEEEISSITEVILYLQGTEAGKTYSIKAEPIFVEGTEAKPYEAYGATPSPEFESPIKTVGQNVNIYNKETMPLQRGLWADKSSISSNVAGWYVVVPITGGKTCTISKKYSANDYTGLYLGVGTTSQIPKNGVKMVDGYVGVGSTAKEYTFTPSYEAKYLFIGLGTSSETLSEEMQQLAIEELKIVEGTSTGSYSPDGQGSVEIYTVNENFLDIEDIYTSMNVTINENTATDIELETTDYNITSQIYFRAKGLKANTTYNVICYTDVLSGNVSSSTGRLELYKNDNSSWIKQVGAFNPSTLKSAGTFTVDADGDYNIRYLLCSTNELSGTLKVRVRDFMVYEGTNTEYIQHQSQKVSLPTQKEFVKIGDVEDTFIKQNGKWYEKHYINKYNFTGDENWSVSSTNTSGENRFYMILPKEANDNARNINCISNKFKGIAEPEMYNQTEGMACTSQRCYIFINDKKTLTANEFKTYINEIEDMYLYYILLEPELIECTEEQEKILNSFHTYKNVTNIWCDGIAVLKVNYKKDLETLINNIATATVALGGDLNV